jgi:hypothetical protein
MGGHHALALTQDETLVATVGQEKRLTLWDLRDPLPIATTDLSSNPSSPDEALTVWKVANDLARAYSLC